MPERFDDRGYQFQFDETRQGMAETIIPKGIDGARALRTAGTNDLLAQHLRLERSDSRAFWKDGFILFKLWATGNFCQMAPEGQQQSPYPYTREGFYQFLHDSGSQMSPDDIGRRMKVFLTYHKYDLTIIRLVERAGVNKAYAAIPHVMDETVRQMFELVIDTPYHRVRMALQAAYPRQDTGRIRARRPSSDLRTDRQKRVARVISDSPTGLVGSPPIFIPRQYRAETEDEYRAREVFEFAMNRLGVNDRDSFFMRVVDLVAKTWLTPADIQAINTRLEAIQAGEQLQATTTTNP